MYRKKFQRIASTALISAACAAAPVFADSFTWTGGGDNPNWDDTATSGTSTTWPNWTDTSVFGSPHLPGAADSVSFGSGFASGDPNLNGSRSVRGMTLDTAASFSLVGNAGDTLTLNSGDLSRTSASAGTQTFAVPVIVDSPYSWTLNGSGAVVFNAGLSDDGKGSNLTKNGSADLVFAGGTTTLSKGLAVAGGNTIVDSASFTSSNGTLFVAGPFTDALSVSNPGNAFIARNGATVSTAGDAGFSNGGSALFTGIGTTWTHMQGPGTGIVHIASTGSGSLTISDGAAASMPSLAVGSGGTLLVQNGASLNGTALNLAPVGQGAANVTITGAGSKLDLNNVQLGQFNQPSGPMSLMVSSGAQANVSFAYVYSPTASIVVDGGALTIGEFLNSNGAVINLKSDPAGGHALTLNGTSGFYSGQITGSGSVMISSAKPYGSIELDGVNTYTGPTIVASGLLVIGGSSTGTSYEVQNGGGLQMWRNAVVNLGSGEIRADGYVDYDEITVNGGFIHGAGPQLVGGDVNSNGTTFNGTTIGSDASIEQRNTMIVNHGTVAGALLPEGPSTLTLNDTAITSSGKLMLQFGNVIADSLSSGGTTTVGFHSTLTNNSGTLALGPGSTTTVQKTGALTLANSTSADLRGGLLVNDGTITGPVNVYYGALAKGSGTYNGRVSVVTGGKFSPGDSPGAVSTTSALWDDGGRYVWEVAALPGSGTAGVDWDLWNAGDLQITSTGHFQIELQSLGSNPGGGLAGWNSSQSERWLIATAADGAFTPDALSHLTLDGSAFMTTNPPGEGSFMLSASPDGDDLYLNFVTPAGGSVPEPASVALIGIGAAGLLLRRKDRSVTAR